MYITETSFLPYEIIIALLFLFSLFFCNNRSEIMQWFLILPCTFRSNDNQYYLSQYSNYVSETNHDFGVVGENTVCYT